MPYIKTISYKEATGKLKRIYDKVQGPNGHIDHVLSIHSLRPHTLEGHMALYKSVLHQTGNTLPKWYLETIGTYISQINNCDYCTTHHAVGLKNNLKDDNKYQLIMAAMEKGNFSEVLSENQVAGLILEINQVTSYFNYVNRMVVGLGVNLEKDNIGLSPSSSDSDDWSHK